MINSHLKRNCNKNSLHKKVNKGGSGKAATANGGGTGGTNSAKRKMRRKHSSVSAKNNNNNNEASAAAASVDWRSLDDADSSSSLSDEKAERGVATELGPDLVQQCNGGMSPPTNVSAATGVVAGGAGGGVSAAEKK